MRVGAPIFAAVVLGFLLPAAEGAERAAVDRTGPEAQEPAPDALSSYLRLTRRALVLREERRSAALALSVARRSLARSERRLGARLRALYQLGRPDPLEVVLGARSLDAAMGTLEGLRHISREEAEQVSELRRKRGELEVLVRRIRAREAEAAALRAQAALVVRELTSRVSSRPKRPSRPKPALAGQFPRAESEDDRRFLTVTASGYSIAGRTATGLPAGVGTVAVDPAVIPLGAALTIPGYGDGVAADTGGAVQGAAIDLWFPTTAQANAWGRRIVTIAVHPG